MQAEPERVPPTPPSLPLRPLPAPLLHECATASQSPFPLLLLPRLPDLEQEEECEREKEPCAEQ